MLRLGERLEGFSQLFLGVEGEFQGSVSLKPNNYSDLLDVTHVKHKEIFLRENFAQDAFPSVISMGIFYSEYCKNIAAYPCFTSCQARDQVELKR